MPKEMSDLLEKMVKTGKTDHKVLPVLQERTERTGSSDRLEKMEEMGSQDLRGGMEEMARMARTA